MYSFRWRRLVRLVQATQAIRASLLFVGVFAFAGCGQPTETLVVYCSLDREFAEPILREYEGVTNVKLAVKYDTEATKSVGLAELIVREKANPRCDLFWANEPLHTVRLAQQGVLARAPSEVGNAYPPAFRSVDQVWYGFAARARVLLVHREKLNGRTPPVRLADLADPTWRGEFAYAKPLFGTTATHVTCLFQTLGAEQTKDLLRRWKSNGATILSGNKQVARAVGSGQFTVGLTDTDDALDEVRSHKPVEILWPDAGASDLGVLVLPNTLALPVNAPHADQARRLRDYLLRPEIESRLAKSPSGQYPLHPATETLPQISIPMSAKRMTVDFDKAAEHWEAVAKFVRDELTAP